MAEQGNGDQHAILNNVRNREDEMRRWCNELPEDRKAALLDGGEDEPGSDDDDDDFDPDQSYIIPTTRAIVTLNSSVALIHYFCNALPADSFCNLRAQFDITSEGDGYVSRITLPSNSPVREVVSEVLRSKSLAKSSAALKACMLLHQKKALNDHLLPVFESEKDLMEEHRDEKGLLEGSKKRKSHYPKKVPDFWALPEGNSVVTLQTLYMTMLYVNLPDNMYDGQKYRTLCLLTRDVFPTIPAFNIFFRGVSKVVDVVPVHVPISLDHDKLEKLYTFTMKLCSSIVNKEFLCPLEEMPFLVVPLLSKAKVTPDGDGNEKLIDWDEIMKAVENRTLPVDPDDVDSLMDTVIIDHADNQRRYFVQAIRRDMTPLSPIPEGMRIRETGYESFADYYHKRFELLLERHDQPLIEVRKVSKVMNFLQAIPGVMPKQKGRVATYVVPEYCHRFSICASVFRSAMMLPSLLMRMDAFLGIREFRLSHGLHIDDHLLLEAFTTPSANMEMNYERLETLGDSFLKFVVTIRLYILFPDKHEGQLHSERIRIICNRALYKSAKELRLFKRILSMPFNRRLWRPPRFTAKIDNQPEMQDTLRDMTEHGLSDKTLADVVEASFGAAYLTGGVEAALRCCIAMQVPFDNITTWSHFNEAYVTDRHKRPVRADPKTLRSINVAKVEEITGHTFQNRLLIAEALTHASLPNSTCPCYQRLEFLGDAVLDFLVIRYLFNKYPNAAPGIMTELKDASVNNHILGAICLRVGLHRHVAHFSSKLVGAITQFVTAVSEMDKNGECVGEYWSDLDVPKVLSDVVESMLGAVFVDSGFRTEAVEHMFAKWVEPVLDKHVTPETLKVHPLKLLTTRIQQDRCSGLYLRYVAWFEFQCSFSYLCLH
ncbi:ribonuclease III domain-containing protein [Jimgerdemannia flammicorona]|uniref:Ribonuclease III domain-containing protein n=1 Tax=Jimgerdemannia flammicorona TaxID=994334 RepID=A0A433CZ12_9FUNG|nr:ribonuclease III domain-containing protein [Jimgerdemannia flammicorona]